MAMLVCQEWIESEYGWGIRPDGFSLHLSEDDRQAFLAAYWETMPDAVPDEYSRPYGSPYPHDATAEQAERTKGGQFGARFYADAPTRIAELREHA